MDPSPALEQRPGKIRTVLYFLESIVSRSYTIQCLLLLHLLSWSAESTVHIVLLLVGIVTVIYFSGFRRLNRLVYETAVMFSFFVVVLKGLFTLLFIFALYEVILNILGYHSEDYKKFKHKMELVLTELSSVTCTSILNTTSEGVVVLGPNDVINLCHAIWYILYIMMIAMGLYMGMPGTDRIRKDNFWTNLYFTVLMVVLWKMFESCLLCGYWQSTELQRASCVYVHYIRYGEAGFKSIVIKQ